MENTSYSYIDPFGNQHQFQPHRNSNVDFTDVFGGPPRRSSVYDLQHRSRADSLDSFSSSLPVSSGRKQSSGLAQKPAFGEVVSPTGRRQQNVGDGFYDDIFVGSDSRGDKDGFPSLSRSGSFVGGSARIFSPNSPPSNLAKGMEYSASSSPTHRVPLNDDPPDVLTFLSSPDKFSFSRLFPQNDRRNAGNVGYKQSPLAGQGTRATHSQYQKEVSTLENFISKNQFHFSIYKWASKGVSLEYSSSSKDKAEIISGLRKLPEVVIKAVDLVSDDDDMSTTTATSYIPGEIQDNSSTSAIFMEVKDIDPMITDDILPDVSDKKDSNRSKSEYSDKGVEGFSAAVSGTSTTGTRNLRQFLADPFEQQGRNTEQRNGSQKDANNTVKSKKQARKESKLDQVEDYNRRSEENLTVSDDKMTGNKVKGKVKNFMKKFSNEGGPKHKNTFVAEEKLGGKDSAEKRSDDRAGVSTENVDKEITSGHNEEGAFVFVSTEFNEAAKDGDMPYSYENSSSRVTNNSFSETKVASKPSSEPIQETVNIPVVDTPVNKAASSPYKEPKKRLDEQKPEEQNIKEQNVLQQDEIRAADAKVREWSKGKEGNIRSLLTTLQFVLWTGSGWKPVPLVDIIESNSVKKAYQRALLCLHPDKLQQRGASMQQKYIAEKVFDILQEAWDLFNSVNVF